MLAADIWVLVAVFRSATCTQWNFEKGIFVFSYFVFSFAVKIIRQTLKLCKFYKKNCNFIAVTCKKSLLLLIWFLFCEKGSKNCFSIITGHLLPNLQSEDMARIFQICFHPNFSSKLSWMLRSFSSSGSNLSVEKMLLILDFDNFGL